MGTQLLGLVLLMLTGLEAEVELSGGGLALGPSARFELVQLKPHERGNCFQWPNCRGDSIGAMWVDDPDICKALGGKSWMAPDRKCYNLPGGPHHIQGP